jgi:NhaP-type Na+/H+ or K+/H+ antiporter
MLLFKIVPAVLAFMFGLRWLLMSIEAPLLSLVGHALSWKDVLFSACGGLRGGLALILAQTVLANQGADPKVKVRQWVGGGAGEGAVSDTAKA